MDFKKSYCPKEFESSIYQKWLEEGKFIPKKSKTGKTFYIPIPPPNVTWNLHLWHALTLTLEDIMVRYHRMKWDDTVWIPWTDHAWIATQNVVENKLAKQWLQRTEIWREKFLEEVWNWKDEYASNINWQIKLLWASVDWSKERFTLDEWLNKTVEHVFCDLYNKWLIYRWEYMVNYSPALQTVISDIEVEYKEEDAKMYYITYFVSWSDNEIIVATTRPETLLADQAVAVHPKDKRYKKLIWRKVILPILNKELPIIWDDTVDKEFWTGALKITPAHDPTDFQIAKKHWLKLDYRVVDKSWFMTREAWIFAGQDAITARENIVELLKAKWNLVRIEPYSHKVGYCERSGCKIETVISTQWFVKADELAKNVIAGYKKKDFTIMPDKFNKVFEDWIYNLRDWCISRQLWWWHQIPAYYDINTWELLAVTQDAESVFKKYWKENVRRDNDVLDTWFSSALWPFSILDWDPKSPWELFKKYYPSQVLETGHDILFFWVIRMLLMGYEYTWETPFKTVYLHGLVKDEQWRKMSKSLWNGIDPLDIVNEYSADSLRLALAIGNTPWNNMNFSIKNVEANSMFLNKLWNITRFVHSGIWEIGKSYDELRKFIEKNYSEFSMHEKWICQKLAQITEKMTEWMEKFNFSMTGEDLMAFTRDDFADFFIEEYKLTKADSKYAADILAYSVMTILKLWHPYAPFVTEELYSKLRPEESLIDSAWPELKLEKDSKIEKDTWMIYDVIRSIRNIRWLKWIKPGLLVKVIFKATKSNQDLLEENQVILKWLCKIEEFKVVDKSKSISEDDYVYWVSNNIEIFLDPGDTIDQEAEKLRLKEQIDGKKDYIRKLDQKLMNAEFVRNAPEHVVRIEQEKRVQAQDQLEKLLEKYNKI
ncbi:MAG: Valyl-tRNA synthetase [uncultured bacterium (gcode 4)]|uniref:Valine--tRNA ligase n=1 Tax=uncultured bacterium (gcode 4) TaxID=1234023 RepID=K2G4U2_9BACT|nr:MAG: Valyl-tRNA synthetase [uncultured bacterium (gcode 4)]